VDRESRVREHVEDVLVVGVGLGRRGVGSASRTSPAPSSTSTGLENGSLNRSSSWIATSMEAFIPSSYFETVRRETPSSVARRPSDQPRSSRSSASRSPSRLT